MQGIKRLAVTMALIIMALAVPTTAARACTTSGATLNLGSISSYTVGTTEQSMKGAAGLSCNVTLALLTTHYVYLKLESTTQVLTGPGGTIPFTVSRTAAGGDLPLGSTQNLSSFSLVSLFAGSNSSSEIYVKTTKTEGLKAGKYSGSVTLRWYYSVCSLGLLACLGYDSSPNFVRPNTLGTGTAVTIDIELTVANDCFITAPNLTFGTAPLVTAFPAVTRTIDIRCTAGSAYSVGLDNGRNALAGVRRMRSGSNYLKYEIYKSATAPERWGPSGAQRRSSATAEHGEGQYDSTTVQQFTYRAVVDPTQLPAPPSGTYADIVIVDVTF